MWIAGKISDLDHNFERISKYFLERLDWREKEGGSNGDARCKLYPAELDSDSKSKRSFGFPTFP